MADASDPWVAYTGPCARCRRQIGYLAWPLELGPCCGACRAALDPAWVVDVQPPLSSTTRVLADPDPAQLDLEG